MYNIQAWKSVWFAISEIKHIIIMNEMAEDIVLK